VLLIAFVGLVAGIALAVVYRVRISDRLHDALQEGLNKYDNDTGCQEAVDLMQSQVISLRLLTYLCVVNFCEM